MEWLEIIRDLSIPGAAVIAVYWIDSWRREHVGRRSIDLAEEALALFYEARDVIVAIRFPLAFMDETSEVKRNDGEIEDAYIARKRAAIVPVRFERNKDLFSRIHALRYRFMA